jgi:adenylate cyclase
VAEAQAEEAEVRRISPNFPLQFLRTKRQKEEIEHSFKRSLTENLKARAYFLSGLEYFARLQQEANAEAQQLWGQAVTLDPQFAAAHAMLGYTHLFEWIYQWSQNPRTLEQALTQARKAIALDDSLPLAHSLLGQVYLLKKQHERALVEAERAIALDPDSGDSYVTLAAILVYTGRSEEATGILEKALQLNPRLPASLLSLIGRAYYLTGRQAEAVDALQKALPLNPNYLLTHVYLAVIYSELDRAEEARTEVMEMLRLSPNFSLEGWQQGLPYKDPAQAERDFAALRKAGFK